MLFLPDDWNGVLEFPRCSRTVLDTHHYVVFDPKLEQTDAIELSLLQKEAGTRLRNIRGELYCEHPRNVMVGEWSIAMHPSQLKDLDWKSASRSFANAQLLSFQGLKGWFFWTLKLDRDDYELWNFSKCVNQGILPDSFRHRFHNIQEISSKKEEAQKTALEDHLRYWKENPSNGWHYSQGFTSGWETQVDFASKGEFIGSLWDLVWKAMENHLAYWREKGLDFTVMGWHYRHGYINGAMKARDNLLVQ